MQLAERLEKMNLSVEYAALSEQTCPVRPFFLEEDFLRRTFPIAGLPAERLPEVIRAAKAIRENAEQRVLAWHYYKHSVAHGFVRTSVPYPDQIQGMTLEESGMLHLIIQLTLIPLLEERAEREGFPVSYAHAAASRIGTYPTYFAQAYPGKFGIRGQSLRFMLNFKDTSMFRIGRFDFVLSRAARERFPEIYRTQEGRIIAFCNDKWHITQEGIYHYSDTLEEGEREVSFFDDGKTVCGTLIDLGKAVAGEHETALPRAGLTRVAGTGDWVLDYHIPAGGGMKPELCWQSFLEALDFFGKYYADKPIKAVFSTSWIFDPAWLDYIPNSNMAALIRTARLFPSTSGKYFEDKSGFYFVFGRTDDDFSTYPQNNSLERALLECYRAGRLRPAGMFLLPDEIRNSKQ